LQFETGLSSREARVSFINNLIEILGGGGKKEEKFGRRRDKI
jgi:hypothetical protein